MSANFTPDMVGYKGLSPFRFWCQKTLPLVYDDSLSYYELLCKVVSYINNLITDVAATEENVDRLLTAYNQLQEYVNDYFDGEDFQQKIDDSLDRYAEDGTLSRMVNTHVTALLPYEVGQQIGAVVDEDLGPVVDLKLPAVVESKIAAPVATQLPGVVQNQIDAVVGNQIDGAVAGQIDEVVADQITDAVSPLVHDEVTGLIRPAVSAELPAALQVYLPPEVQTQLPAAIGTDLETIAPPVIEDWLDAHPEATTSVPDGSISFSKLATDLQRRAGIVGTYFPADFTNEYAWQVNQYAVYQGIVYRCIKTTTAGQAWNASEWTTANMNSDLFYMWWCLNYLSQSITTIDSSPATSAHEAGEYFIYYDGAHLYRLAKASSNIAVGDTLTVNGNFIYSSVANMIADLKVEIADLKSAFNGYKPLVRYSPTAFELGRVVNTGEFEDATNRLRFPFFYPIKAGSKISVDSGYKFNVIVRDTTNTNIIDFRGMGTDDYVCKYDGFFEISLGSSDDADMSVDESSHIHLSIVDESTPDNVNGLSNSTYRFFVKFSDNTLILPAEKSNSPWRYKWIECTPGEYITIIKGTGTDGARLWAFTATNTGSSISIINVASSGSVANNTILKVPDGANYLLLQSNTECWYINGVLPDVKETNTFGYKNLNQFIAYEDGHFKTADGSRGLSSAQSYHDHFRTIQYLDKRIRTVLSLTSMRVFKYTAQGGFISTVTLQNEFVFNVPEDNYLYRIDFLRTAIDADWQETAKSIVMLTKNFDSDLERVLDRETFGAVPGSWFAMTAEMDEGFTANTDYSTFISAIDTLVDNSHGYITKTQLGVDSDSLPIYMLTLSGLQINGIQYGTRPKILITAGIQGSERSNIFGLYYFIKMLSENYTSDPLLSFIHANIDLRIIPCISPWGFNNKQYWNKNEVSLNRNFGVDGWTKNDKQTDPYNYTGEEANDQPETNVVIDFLNANKDAIALIDSHTYGDGVVDTVTNMDWHNYYNRRDVFFRSMQSASKRHVQTWTGWLRSKYGVGVDGSLSGRVGRVDPSSEDYKKGTLTNYATNVANIPAVTHEGFNGFYGTEQTYTADVFRANTECLGNFVGELLRWAL